MDYEMVMEMMEGLQRQVDELVRRTINMIRRGKVAVVNADGTYNVELLGILPGQDPGGVPSLYHDVRLIEPAIRRTTVLRFSEDSAMIDGSGAWDSLVSGTEDTTDRTIGTFGTFTFVDPNSYDTENRVIEVLYDQVDGPAVDDIVFLYFPNGVLYDSPFIIGRSTFHATTEWPG